MADDLARAFLGSGPAGYGVSPVMGAFLTEWHYPGTGPDDPDLYANLVTDGAYTFRDRPVLYPSRLVLGRVLLLFTPAGPVILGNSYQDSTASPGTNPPGGGSVATVDSGLVDVDTITA